MEQQIWKFPLRITDEQVIKIPKGSVILCVQQHGYPCIWAQVFPHMEMVERTIEVFGTGHTMQQDGENQRSYLGTVQINQLVWHIFERFPASSNTPPTHSPTLN